MDKGQTKFYSNDELKLIEATFKGDSQKLTDIRNIFWQFKSGKLDLSKELVQLLKKVFIPEFAPDIPLYQQRDLYTPLFYIKESNPGIAHLHILANDILVQYVNQQFNEMIGKPVEENCKIILKDLTAVKGCDQEEIRFVNMLAYHKIYQFLDNRIGELITLATPPKELTEKEKAEKATKDSNK